MQQVPNYWQAQGPGDPYIAGTVDDIAMASTAARRHNSQFNVTVVPKLNQNGGGLALVGRF